MANSVHVAGAASPLVTPEVAPLIAMGTLSPMRIFVSLAVLLVFLLVAFFSPRNAPTKRKAQPKGISTVVLAGPMGAGKTALFYKVRPDTRPDTKSVQHMHLRLTWNCTHQLLYNQQPMTHTSMEKNEALVESKWTTASNDAPGEKGAKEVCASTPICLIRPNCNSVIRLLEHPQLGPEKLQRPYHLVDTPGHPRLRTRSLTQFLPTTDRVVFVVDAINGTSGKNVRETGEHLHVVLSLLSKLSSLTHRDPPPLLILLAKSDRVPSKSLSLTLDRARQSLAREMERRRVASHTSSNRAGARLEGLDAIPASATSQSILQLIMGLFGLGSAPPPLEQEVAGVGLPSDEAEVLNISAFNFEGEFAWEKLDVQIEWAMASVREDKATPGVGSTSGLETLLEWIER
ncbi:BZ3500_MvSof-1268-A1-R1_Chr4-2g07069 [Microbotryum saponariae]|uniref:Signal recognition particle receptor subunit beta n=1 Tax=Microbotryum saponariae TaxID=289078 RepID=A0A2X0KTI9_9BASI|nr:BZ3500_MvSof-1268-A1-R1_Chr4-2g07069 [Microbotryum saponariae]SDA06734.1 BZ3501_MvSof-1269-A2-R1_Chr4-2g06780 [Microbotryum saponariae]